MSRKRLSLEATFKYLHENPPAPFNPDFKPYAKACSAEASRLVGIEEGEPATWTREYRAKRRREVYEELMAKEEEKR